jgi:hypothetical protein
LDVTGPKGELFSFKKKQETHAPHDVGKILLGQPWRPEAGKKRWSLPQITTDRDDRPFSFPSTVLPPPLPLKLSNGLTSPPISIQTIPMSQGLSNSPSWMGLGMGLIPFESAYQSSPSPTNPPTQPTNNLGFSFISAAPPSQPTLIQSPHHAPLTNTTTTSISMSPNNSLLGFSHSPIPNHYNPFGIQSVHHQPAVSLTSQIQSPMIQNGFGQYHLGHHHPHQSQHFGNGFMQPAALAAS